MVCCGSDGNRTTSELKEVFKGLGWVEKLLPLWILLAMILGTLLSVYVPSSHEAFKGASWHGVSAPLVVGLVIMMVPPLCKVEWENFIPYLRQPHIWKQIVISLVLNWIFAPFFMLGVAWATLPDLPEYRTGVIMTGLARCIAMVLIWNTIAKGDNTLCATLVVINSALQLVLYAPLQVLFCHVISGDSSSSLEYELVAQTVGIYLGIPLAIGLLIRLVGIVGFGKKTYNERILPVIGPWALIALLYTVIVIFIMQGYLMIRHIGNVFRTFVPLTLYFTFCWFGSVYLVRMINSHKFWRKPRTTSNDDSETGGATAEPLLCGCEKDMEARPKAWKKHCSADYNMTMTQAFTAASNNFELSIAVAVALYGPDSKQALAATVGPLIEVPVLLALSYLALYFRRKFLWTGLDDENNQ